MAILGLRSRRNRTQVIRLQSQITANDLSSRMLDKPILFLKQLHTLTFSKAQSFYTLYLFFISQLGWIQERPLPGWEIIKGIIILHSRPVQCK